MILPTEPLVVVLVLYLAACYCGVIDETLIPRGEEIGKRTAEPAEDAVNYGGWPEVVSDATGNAGQEQDTNVALGYPENPSVKQKRCPSTQQRLQSRQNFGMEQIVGAKTPSGLEKRGVQSKVMQLLCTNCQNKPPCKIHNQCDQCNRWCIIFNSNDLPASTNVTNDVPNVSSPNVIQNAECDAIKLQNRFTDTVEDNIDDSKVSLQEPGDSTDPKRVFTIGSFSSGLFKKIICNLLGIEDTSDIDKMVIWVTTKSNEPPKFAEGYENNVPAQTEKLTASLNEELNKALAKNKIDGKQFLTNEQMENIAERFLDAPYEGTSVKSPSNSFDMVPRFNPDVVQDTFNSKLLGNSEQREMLPIAPTLGSKEDDSEEESGEDFHENKGRMNGVPTIEQGANSANPTPPKDITEIVTDLPVLPETTLPEKNGNEVQPITEPEMDTLGSTKLQHKNQDKEMNSPMNVSKQSMDGKSNSMVPSTVKPAIYRPPKIEQGGPLKQLLGNKQYDTITDPSSNLSEPDDKSETLNEKEPVKTMTKNLLQQIKDKMEERVKSRQNIPNISKLKPGGSKLGNPENAEPGGKTEGNENILSLGENSGIKRLREKIKDMQDMKLKSAQVSPKNKSNFDKLEEEAPNNLEQEEKKVSSEQPDVKQIANSKARPSSLDQIEEDASKEMDNTKTMTEEEDRPNIKDRIVPKGKPKIVNWGFPKLRESLSNSKDTKNGSGETVSATNPLQDNLSEILEHLKKGTPRIVNSFDTAKDVLNEVRNMVGDIGKATNINDIKNPSTLGATNEDEASLGSSGDPTRGTSIPDLNPTELGGKEMGKLGNTLVPSLGSQPLESVIWDKRMNPGLYQKLTKFNTRLGNSPMTDDIPTKHNKIDNGDNERISSTTVLQNRGKFSSKEPGWSNSLGKLVPFKQDQKNDMYFVGNGIKLPLQMVRNNDGEMQLSVDLDRLCSCKNSTTCVKNGAAMAETLGGLLGGEANMEQAVNGRGISNAEQNEEDTQDMSESHEESEESSSIVTLRNDRGIQNSWLNIKNSVARHLNPNNEEYLEGEDNNVFKRSTGKSLDKEGIPEKIVIPIGNSVDLGKEHANVPNILFKFPNSVVDNNKDNLVSLQQFLNNKLGKVKSNMMDTERQNVQKLKEVEEKLEDALLGAVNMNTRFQSKMREKEGYDVFPKPLENFNFKNKKDAGNEIFDFITPIKNAKKFKKVDSLQTKLEELDENEGILKKEADIRLKAQKNSFIKKEVDIMNNILEFLKNLTGDKKNK